MKMRSARARRPLACICVYIVEVSGTESKMETN